MLYDLKGWDEPPIYSLPDPPAGTFADECIDLAAAHGLFLDPWQKWLLIHSLGYTDQYARDPITGEIKYNIWGNPILKWSAYEVGVMVSRQNGKGSFLEARELAGLLLFGERVIVHSAHEHQTAMNHMQRMEDLMMSNPETRSKIASVRHSNDEKMILMKSGQKLLFKTRTGRGGRGLTGDCIVLDEAMYVQKEHIAALQFTLATVPNPQIIYTGSAGTKESISFGALRKRALAVEHAKKLFYAEWSIDPHTGLCLPDCVDHDDPASDEAVAKANPSAGYHFPWENIWDERESLLETAREWYLQERLGVGSWPEEAEQWSVISKDAWMEVKNRFSSIESKKVVLGVHTTYRENRYHTTIVAAGRNIFGEDHVEITGRGTILDSRPGTQWVLPELIRMCSEHDIEAVVIHKSGHAAAFIATLEFYGIRVITPTAQEFADSCTGFLTSVVPVRDESPTVCHIGQPVLTAAVAAGVKKDVGNTWIWDQKLANAEIGPLYAATLALWGFRAVLLEKPPVEPWVRR